MSDKEYEIKPQYAVRTQNKWKFKGGGSIKWLSRQFKLGDGKVRSIMCSTPTTYNDSIREQFFNNLLGKQISKEELERMIENSYSRRNHLIFKKAVDKCRESLNELDNKIIEDIKKENNMKQTLDTFIGLSDGIPDCYVSVEEEDGIKFLTMREKSNTTTLKLDKEAIEYLKLIIEWAEQNEK